MNNDYLDFEQPIAELEAKIIELKLLGTDNEEINIAEEISRLEIKNKEITKSIFKSLSAWQIVQLARHPKRPYSLDYIERVFTDFQELHGDRAFADDKAMVAGLARLDGTPVMILGQQKGRDTKEKVLRNFGMPHPEGYRKAKRLIELAERFNLPIICLIDTPGAYPGIGAEERGQSEAIAQNLLVMSKCSVPIICVIIGEGCSGGALGIGVGDRMLIMEYAYFATISPEGCAAILWKGADKASEAAEIMGITAKKLRELDLVDEIIPEPLGGAHRDINFSAANLKERLIDNLRELKALSKKELLDARYEKIVKVGRS
ncbi:MAG: acetyl-CoA carboxylase carboxyl transferase subunit alpha [Francisellaceae bacterium]|jgi:acetyl-CoA carboxylase carboxyl transferase subunit alpha|nr:acetyl-CoA carboxylase carboxyl transferase subunit alpha [Francisellaceae bacterium]MBT6207986.1 acetyl-CoA carboxylase carboxyl transferase subunit alpha [Francisellaceae bacterium]MBT6537974.1 acetyl-CoA carboxylase carboxyl transferase subunit alpha [Francisellaceae bacterium]